MVHTVCQNYKGYTKKQVQKDVLARKVLGILRTPSTQDLEYLVIRNFLDYLPIKIHDVKNSHAIFGPDLTGVIGRTDKNKPGQVEIYYVAIPRELLNSHKYMNIVFDVMFINNIPFLITMSCDIRLITV